MTEELTGVADANPFPPLECTGDPNPNVRVFDNANIRVFDGFADIPGEGPGRMTEELTGVADATPSPPLVSTGDLNANVRVFDGFADVTDESGGQASTWRGAFRAVFSRVISLSKMYDMKERHAGTLQGKVRIHSDVSYIDDGDDKHKLDVYCPATHRPGVDPPLPAIVFYHGGGWVRGDRSIEFRGAPAVARRLASAGYVVLAPSYRLGRSPDYIEDAREAVEWTMRHLDTLGIDKNEVWVGGHR